MSTDNNGVQWNRNRVDALEEELEDIKYFNEKQKISNKRMYVALTRIIKMTKEMDSNKYEDSLFYKIAMTGLGE